MFNRSGTAAELVATGLFSAILEALAGLPKPFLAGAALRIGTPSSLESESAGLNFLPLS